MEIHTSKVAFVFIVTVASCLASTTDSATSDTTPSDLTTASADSTSTAAAGGSTASADSTVSSTVASTAAAVTNTECYNHTCVGSNCLSGNLTFAPKCNTTGKCYLSVFRNGTTVTTVTAGCEEGTCSTTVVSVTASSGETNNTRCCSTNLCNVESLINFHSSGSLYLPSLFSIIILLVAQAFVNAHIC